MWYDQGYFSIFLSRGRIPIRHNDIGAMLKEPCDAAKRSTILGFNIETALHDGVDTSFDFVEKI